MTELKGIRSALVGIMVFLTAAVTVSSGDDDFGARYDYKVREDEIEGDEMRVRRRMRLTVFNERGVENAVFATYKNRYRKLEEVTIRLLDAEGAVVNDWKKGDLSKSCGFGSSYQVYSDICRYIRRLHYSHYPFVMEVVSEAKISSLFFWAEARFQEDIPVAYASYRLSCDDDFEFDYRLYGSDVTPNVTTEDGRRVYHWELHDIPAVPDIDYAPDGYPEVARIVFLAREFDFGDCHFSGPGWRGIGRWYRDLARESYLDRSAEPTAATDGDWRVIMKAIYDDIVDNFRYVSISIGLSSWRPTPAESTLAAGYGDCKALSTLLISRLRSAGIEAYPVLALTRGGDRLDVTFPAFDFNHAFVMAVRGGDTVWMDPTCRYCAMGDLPYHDEFLPVLVVTDSGGVLGRTPASRPKENVIHRQSLVRIGGDGRMDFETVIDYSGNYLHRLKNNLAHCDRDEAGAFVEGLLPGGIKNFIVHEYNINNPGGHEEPLVIELSATLRRPVDELGGVMYVMPDIFDDVRAYDGLGLDGREIPFRMGYPRTISHDLVIVRDSDLAVDSVVVPPDADLEYPFGGLSNRYAVEGDSIFISLSRRSGLYELRPEDFSDFSVFRDSLAGASRQYVMFYR